MTTGNDLKSVSRLSRNDDPRINADPPAASGSPLQGQHETNSTGDGAPGSAENEPIEEGVSDPLQRAAYEFVWQSYLQYGRSPSTRPASFDALEATLERDWEKRQNASSNKHPWTAARDMARDAWSKVQDAMAGEDV